MSNRDENHSRVRAPRCPVETAIRFRRLDDSAWRLGQIENVSRSGVLFRCDLAIRAGTWIEMGFTLPGEVLGGPGAAVRCHGFVSRVERPTARRIEPRLAVAIPRYRFVREEGASRRAAAP
ncbi:MAG: PilZ domain-containing protein [Terriglobia bacterium]